MNAAGCTRDLFAHWRGEGRGVRARARARGEGRGARGEGRGARGEGRGARVSRRAAPETGTSSGGHGREAIGRSLCSASPTPASKRWKAASKAANTW